MRTEETQNSGGLINERAWEARVVRMGQSQIPRARIQVTFMGNYCLLTLRLPQEDPYISWICLKCVLLM